VSNINDLELRCIAASGFTEGDDEDIECVGVASCGSRLQTVGL